MRASPLGGLPDSKGLRFGRIGRFRAEMRATSSKARTTIRPPTRTSPATGNKDGSCHECIKKNHTSPDRKGMDSCARFDSSECIEFCIGNARSCQGKVGLWGFQAAHLRLTRKPLAIDASRDSMVIITDRNRGPGGRFSMAHEYFRHAFGSALLRCFRELGTWAQAQSSTAPRKKAKWSSTAPWKRVSAQRIIAAFEKKYPFIKVDATRIGSERMATRLVAEAQARKVRADVVNNPAFDFYGVFQKGLFDSYFSPEARPRFQRSIATKKVSG